MFLKDRLKEKVKKNVLEIKSDMKLKVRVLYEIFGCCLFADGGRTGRRHVSVALSNVG